MPSLTDFPTKISVKIHFTLRIPASLSLAFSMMSSVFPNGPEMHACEKRRKTALPNPFSASGRTVTSLKAGRQVQHQIPPSIQGTRISVRAGKEPAHEVLCLLQWGVVPLQSPTLAGTTSQSLHRSV